MPLGICRSSFIHTAKLNCRFWTWGKNIGRCLLQQHFHKMAITMRFSHTYLGVNLPQLPTVFTLNHSLTPIDTPQGGGNQQGGSWDLGPPRVIDKLEGTRMTPWSPFWSLIDLSWSTILTRSSTELPPTISIWMIHFFGWRRRSWNCLVVYRKMRSFFQSSSLTMNRIELLRATATACWHRHRGPTSRRPDGRDLSDGGTLRYVGTTIGRKLILDDLSGSTMKEWWWLRSGT